MNTVRQPLITVLTPVYNGDEHLSECIESILNQTYKNFEYIILNNCSTDTTLEIANTYTRKDSRIRIYNNDRILSAAANHNACFRKISPESKYCKIVQADDW